MYWELVEKGGRNDELSSGEHRIINRVGKGDKEENIGMRSQKKFTRKLSGVREGNTKYGRSECKRRG